MPSFSASSSIRVASEDHVLRLKITHNLVHGSPSDPIYAVNGRLPSELDVLWLSNIALSLSGSLNGADIPAGEIARSGLARNLRTQLNTNADRLGLNKVSRPFVDDSDGLPKMTLSPARPLPDVSRPHANLISLHLTYIWKTISGRSNDADSGYLVDEINLFSPTLFLPAEALLNRVTKQFLIYHLVNRYPLIFGPWCKRLDTEMAYFPSIGRSIVEIMTRSRNSRFLSRCQRLLKIARRQHKFVLHTASVALTSCADDTVSETSEEGMNSLPEMPQPLLTDEQVLCESLEQLFRLGVPQRRFKPAANIAPQIVSLPRDDSMLRCIPDVGADDDDSWMELPETAMSPCAFGAGSFTPLLEEVDVFTHEDWTGGEMWRSHAADEGLGERDQSDESLIRGPTLASITTRSPQAGPASFYPHQDIDDGGLEPARSGSRYRVSQLTDLEDPGSMAVFGNLTRDQGDYEQVMCRDDTGWLDEWSDRGEMADSDSMILDLDGVEHPSSET